MHGDGDLSYSLALATWYNRKRDVKNSRQKNRNSAPIEQTNGDLSHTKEEFESPASFT